ncbi:MAG TPA: hypothetical protein PLP26_00335 [Ilumatobacteraceae bacterium]|nr:hypothetical protein [Ilumatobacteraceae bacterium]
MEDAIAEESYQLLAATLSRGSETEPSRTSVLPAQPSLPTRAPGDTSGAIPVTDEPIVSRPQRRIVVGFNKANNGSLHHTLLPRTMVIAGLLAGLGSPLVGFILERHGHLELDGTNWYLDDRGRSVATAVVASVVACSVLGWLWWTTAAALNARKQARYTVSPIFAPLLIVLMSGCAVLLVGTLRTSSYGDDERTRKALVVTALIVITVVAHFLILEAYRRAAGVIGASQRPWLFVIVLPWVTVAANLLAQFFAKTVGDSYLNVMALGNMCVCGIQVLALYQAMSSFDRACSGRHMAHNERGELPDFLRSR